MIIATSMCAPQWERRQYVSANLEGGVGIGSRAPLTLGWELPSVTVPFVPTPRRAASTTLTAVGWLTRGQA